MDDNIKQEPDIVDAQIVDDQTTDSTPNQITDDSTLNDDNATVISSLDEMIKLNFQRITELSNEQKTVKQMVEDAMAGSEEYKIVSEKAQDVANEKTQVRKKLQSTPEMINLLNKMKDLASERKEKMVALSDYVLEYQRLTGATEVDLGNGEVMEIENSAKLVKKK